MGRILNFKIFILSQVLSVVEKHFSNPVLKEHLQLALSTIEATPIPSSPALSDNSTNGRGKSRKRRHTGGSAGKRKRSSDSKGDSLTPRDVRAKFYSKVHYRIQNFAFYSL